LTNSSEKHRELDRLRVVHRLKSNVISCDVCKVDTIDIDRGCVKEFAEISERCLLLDEVNQRPHDVTIHIIHNGNATLWSAKDVTRRSMKHAAGGSYASLGFSPRKQLRFACESAL
jgi:hypothetical protein